MIEFQQFISTQIESGEPPISPEDCLSRYRAMFPSDEEIDDSVECMKKALEQKANGEGMSLYAFDAQFRERHSI